MKPEALTAGLLLVALAMAAAADAAARSSTSLSEGWTFRQAGREESYPAEVPGVVHLDLQRNGLILDPFFADNEKRLQWIGKTSWEYRTEFAVAADVLERRHQEIVFDGLDTYARVYLNGEPVLDTNNMYRWWRVPVAGKLRPEGNELRVVFRSPIIEDLPKVEASGYRLPAANDHGEGTSPYTRKAPYSFGWDWGPRFVTCGIWKPVRLEAWDGVRIVDVFVRQLELEDDEARLEARVEVLADAATDAAIEVDVTGESGHLQTRPGTVPEGPSTQVLPFEIRNPQRWWPNGLGDQPLYTVRTRLRVGGAVVDERTTRIGLRTVELRREPDEWGKSFEFVVNGVPVFAKGANWIPADSFLPRVTRERYETLLGSARQANMNMIRVWAGGIYESDDFFDVADEMGLLVWEDFHFSCSLYPADEAFLTSVRIEAEQAVRRLRNHPSLALWAGNNEIEWGWFDWGWKEQFPAWVWNDYEKIFHQLLPEVVAEHDPTRPYWPSCPSAGRDTHPNSPSNGDMHYWGVWHEARPFATYETTPARFMSEYGFQSFPELQTIRSFASTRDLRIDSPVMLNHQKHPRGNELIREYMLRDYPEPRDFASFLYVSQVLQAEGIKLGAEYHRRSRPRTMGTLYWQLNDCWPVASWASIDYFGRWKALQYYARRFYENVLVSTAEENGEVSIYVVSDLAEARPGLLEVRLLDLSGAPWWEEDIELTIEPLASRRAFGVPKAVLLEGRDPGAVFLHVRLRSGEETLSTNNRFFVPPKDLQLEKPRITVEVAEADEGYRVTLVTNTLARSVRLTYEPDDGFFGDNYFDLVPGRGVEVLFRPEGDVGLEAFRQGLVVESIVDAFAG
jgi:beta-mannosidase